MRLDKFLFFTRLTKTRSLAQSILSSGIARIDGRTIASAHVKIAPGNVITIPMNDKIRVIQVTKLPSRRGPASEARVCYTDLIEDPIDAGKAKL